MSKEIIKHGMLLENDELKVEYRARKKTEIEKSIDIESSIPESWKLKRMYKTKKRIYKDKLIGDRLEDKVWILFYEMGVKKLSSSKFTISIKQRKKLKSQKEIESTQQIDVLAIDENVVFVVECKSKEQKAKKRLDTEIAKFSNNMKYIRSSIREALRKRSLQFVFVFATENIEWDENDLLDAKGNKILVWNESDINALLNLAKLAGEGAKFQIYNRVFFDKKIKNFNIKVPALKAKMGNHNYYTFILPPEHLLKIAYVHHRSGECSFLELTDSYQRIINETRIRNIQQYIENEGFFPGSIIVNFKRNFPKEEILGSKKSREELEYRNIKPVILTLPPYYGCAWIIDGQHRLYGYADTDEKTSETIPVIAFVEEPEHVQAKLFVDINKNQKSIESDLLWDIYEDLYPKSKEDNEQQLYTISKIAKELNKDIESPFYNSIKIPKEQNEGNISLTTICTNISRQRLIDKEENLLFHKSYKETIEFASTHIAAFFNVIKEQLPEEWALKEKHYINTNAGFVVLLGVLRDIVECNIAKPDELKDIFKFKKVVNKFLEPLLLHFLDMDNETISSLRGAGGAGQKSRQARYELTRVIFDANIGFRSRWLEKYEESKKEEDKYAKKRKGVKYYLDKDESDLIEFKGSLFLDINRLLLGDGKVIDDNEICNEGVLKTIVAFLNSKGGEILLGILEKSRFENADPEKIAGYPIYKDKIIFGIDNEYKKDEWDGYLRRLIEVIENRIGPEILDSELVQIKKLDYEKSYLCLIKVIPSEAKQYLLENRFYIRRGNKTVLLEAKKIDKYWSNRKH